MTIQMRTHRWNPLPLSVTSRCPCSRSAPLPGHLILPSSRTKFKLGLLCDSPNDVLQLPKKLFRNSRVYMAVTRAEQGQIDEGEEIEEVNKSHDVSTNQVNPDQNNQDKNQGGQQKVTQLKKRVISGLAIGIPAVGVVLAGGWVFTIVIAVAVFIGSREYFELVRSRGIAAGMTPPPRYLSRVCSVICALMPILTLYLGHIDVSVTSAAFIVATALLLQRGNPRFSQLSSTMFGLFYCGYLPCFWVKLRCSLSVPALNTNVGSIWPVLLGGQAHWTVGLVATMISMSSIVAADTYAFIGGKAFGRTPLINISPKKTWEGAVAGLTGCVATSFVLSKVLGWPSSWLSMLAFGILNFFGSLFGDLIESMIKRDAGVKDSGSLIPGHGDDFDLCLFPSFISYLFYSLCISMWL